MTPRTQAFAAALGTVALLAGLLGLSWLAIQREQLGHATRLTTISTAPRSVAAWDPALPSPGLPEPAHTVPETARAFDPDELEICGYGVAKAGSDAASALEALAQEGWERATRSHLQRMLVSADNKTRAAALMVSFQFAPLVELALSSSDPTIYAMALAACERRAVVPDRGQACQMLSADQGARLDADNAAAWLLVAAQADARRDAQALDAAMHRASAANAVHYRTAEFAAVAMAAMPAQLLRTERAHVLVAAIGIQAALSMPQLQVLSRNCDEARMSDSNRRQTCSALAELLVTKGPTLMDLAIGRRIGERAGWPRARTEELGARADALMQATIDQVTGAPGGELSCAGAERIERWWRDVSSIGERATAEQALARSGLSQAQITERYLRRASERATQAAAAAASAASAPP